jgi:hypothetical protein
VIVTGFRAKGSVEYRLERRVERRVNDGRGE